MKKCIFDPEIECPVQEQIDAPLNEIAQIACPICPKRRLMELQPPATLR